MSLITDTARAAWQATTSGAEQAARANAARILQPLDIDQLETTFADVDQPQAFVVLSDGTIHLGMRRTGDVWQVWLVDDDRKNLGGPYSNLVDLYLAIVDLGLEATAAPRWVSGNLYSTGDVVTWPDSGGTDQEWRSLVDNNHWTPGATGTGTVWTLND